MDFDAHLPLLERTPHDLASAIQGRSDAELSRRPDARNWAAKEVICHLRDIEEMFMLRFRTMLAMAEPKFLVLGDMPTNREEWGLAPGDPLPLDPDRWAEERQYWRSDGVAALEAFRRRRGESLAFLRRLTSEQRERGSLHATLGRMTYLDWLGLIVKHDAKHLDQLRRALEGRA